MILRRTFKLILLSKFLLLTLISLSVTSSATENLLVNPGFELPDLVSPDNQAPGADGWVTFNTAGVRTAEQNSGDQSLRLAPNAPTGTGTGIARQVFPVSPLDVVSFSSWVLNPSSDPLSGTRVAELRLQWLNDNDTLVNQRILQVADVDTPEDLWINFGLVNVTIPDNPNITQIRPSLFVRNDAGDTGGGVVFFDDVVFVNLTSSTAGSLAVPEPASMAMLAIGCMLTAGLKRRAGVHR